MKIKLQSNFKDYYDYMFCSDHEKNFDHLITRNNDNKGLRREEMFKYFESKGLIVPPYKTLKQMEDSISHGLNFTDNRLIVLYLDQEKHNGEGKILIDFKNAINKYNSDLLASVYITPKRNSESYKLLQIGNYSFILIYRSNDKWRSNCGDVVIEIIGLCPKNLRLANNNDPIYAIDLVKDNNNLFYAIDYNVAPQLKGTGLEDKFSATKIYQMIEEFYEYV